MRIHYQVNDKAACGRGRGQRVSLHVGNVTCLNCKKTPEWIAAKEVMDAARKAAFEAQVPSKMGEPWREGNIVCRECDGDLFRIGDRTCYGHYANFHCATCGHVESRLTETGMSA